MKNKVREEEEKLQKVREDAEEDARILREQDEIERRKLLENDARNGYRRRDRFAEFQNHPKDHNESLLNNIIIKAPKDKGKLLFLDMLLGYTENAFDDELWRKNRDTKKYYDWYPQDVRVGELQRLLELKFQNSQTELKRKFYENIREVKNEIDVKQMNMARHLRELKNEAQKEREEKEKLQLEVDRLTNEKVNLRER